jgi:hypothetical protein
MSIMTSNHNFVHFGEKFKRRNLTIIANRNKVGFVNKAFSFMLSK